MPPIDNIRNPNNLTQAESLEFNKKKDMFIKMFDSLKKKNLIKKPSKTQVKVTLELIKAIDRQSKTFNLFIDIIRDNTKLNNFLKAIEPFGFDDGQIAEMVISLMFFAYVREIETLRIILLTLLKNARSIWTLERLINYCKKENFKYHCSLRNLLKKFKDIRNTFSHGTYIIEGDKIRLYNNASLRWPSNIKLGDFMILNKKKNITFQAFLIAYGIKAREGFFN